MENNPYLGADREILNEVMREAESYLAAQLQSGIAADARAIQFVSVMAAASALIAGAGFTLISEQNFVLGGPALLVSFGFMIAMGLASFSARPTDFFYCGNAPSQWKEDIRKNFSISQSIASQIVNYDDQIMFNRNILINNSRCMNLAIVISWGSVAGGAVYAAIGLAN